MAPPTYRFWHLVFLGCVQKLALDLECALHQLGLEQREADNNETSTTSFTVKNINLNS